MKTELKNFVEILAKAWNKTIEVYFKNKKLGTNNISYLNSVLREYLESLTNSI